VTRSGHVRQSSNEALIQTVERVWHPYNRSVSEAPIQTLLLDAGGVLVFPNWDRVAGTLERHGLTVSSGALRTAEPQARFAIDTARHVAATTDADRGSAYFHLVLDGAGVPRTPQRDAALAELYAYHMAYNLWEHVPDDVRPALDRLRARGLRLAVASNANGALVRVLERVGMAGYFYTICDSHVEGVEKPDPRFFHLVLTRCGGAS
jgi:putative hydrolase of the HAD superfamily